MSAGNAATTQPPVRPLASAHRGVAPWTVCALMATASALLFLFGTRLGIGVLVDSTKYLRTGPIPFDAPLYPWLLQAAALTGLPVVEAARWVGLALVSLNTILVWQLLALATRNLTATVLGTAAIVLAPQFVALHLVAMSEPLFLCLILASLHAALTYATSGRTGWLGASALCIGLAAITRFTAPPLGVALALAVLVEPGRPLSRRLAHAALVGAISGGIFLGWVSLSLLSDGRATGRPLEFLGNADLERWKVTLEAATAFLLPTWVPLIVRVAVLGGVVAAAGWATYLFAKETVSAKETVGTARLDPPAFLAVVLGLFVPLYIAFAVLATMVEANLTINSRYLLPGYVASVVLLTIVLASRADIFGTPARRRLVAAAVIVATAVVASHTKRSVARVASAYQEGIGYAGTAWTQSPIIRAVSALPADAAIVTNGPDAVRFILKRAAAFTPKTFELRAGRPDPASPLATQIALLDAQLAAGPTYVVFMDRVRWRFYLESEASVVRQLGLRLVAATEDGRIYSRGAGLGRGAVDDPVTISAAVSGGRPGATSSQFSQ